MKYRLTHKTGEARCAWCCEPITGSGSHTEVESVRTPHLLLRFHHDCWPTYRSLSGIESGAVGHGGEWTPQRIELLRIHCGATVRDFATRLGLTPDNLNRLMGGDVTLLTHGTLARIKTAAIESRYERTDHVDWSNGVAVFCLRMSQHWSLSDLAREIGTSAQQCQVWQWSGVPERSVRTHGRLTAAARRAGFDEGMVVPHRLWTRDYLREVFEPRRATLPASVWAARAGVAVGTFHQWLRGSRPIVPESAWYLTQAAARLDVPLPPEGLVELRKGAWSQRRQPRSPEHEAKRLAALAESKWTLDTVRALGTAPDREIATRLGRNRNAVAIMRRALEIPTCDARTWDGTDLPQSLSDDELQRRWDAAKAKFIEHQKQQREES